MDRYSELRARAAEFVVEWVRWAEVLVLAPVREAADEVALVACGDALVGVHRLAFRELVLELSAAELNRRALVPVGRIVREALAARVTQEAVSAGRLTYLGPVAGFPGFPRALADTFEELRLNAVPLAQLRECGDSGADLALLLGGYRGELAARGFADHAARVELARLGIQEQLSDRAVVALDLAPRTRSERELLTLILNSARAHLDLRLGAGDAPPQSSLASLQRYLFSADAVPPRGEDGSVEIFSTSGEALECVEIARRIAAAVDRGVPFDQIAIAIRSPERYQPLVVEGLRRAGIPVHCTRGSRRPDVAGRSFLALLHCAEEGLSASRFAEYLSLGQMPDDEEPSTPAAWERLLVDAAVIGGPERWETRLDGLREDIHRRYREEEDEGERARLERRITSVENLRAFALPVIGRLAALPARATWGEWTSALTDLAAFTLRDPERVTELLEELEPMSAIGPVTLAHVLLVIGPRLTSLTAAPKDSRYGKVWVGGIEEARGMAFRSVFVPGVNEGLFPRPPAEDPLLLQAQRQSLGVELRGEDTELLRIAAASASEQFTLSFSRLDLLTGRPRVPSFYAFAAHRAAGGPEIDVREFEARARSATRTRIGWPAPPDPASAIDDAEFDLATLAPLVKGSGEYLKSLPGRAVASLRARWMRWHRPWKPADGLFIEEIGSDALTPYRLTERPWSPTLLQQYARCPYRFALRGIFGLRPAERPAGIQRMNPADRGNLYHAVQFELLRDLAAAGLVPVTNENLAAALDRLDAILQAEAARAESDLAPAIPQIWRAEVQSIRADLRGWLQQKALFEADWTPQFHELSFGLKDPAGRDPRSRKEAVTIAGGYQLQGSIDLVERHISGTVRVVDHKTGRIPEPRPETVGRGEVLQPTLYALAAEAILGEPVAIGRLYYSTIAQNYTAIDVPLHDWTRRRAQHVLEIIDQAIVNGTLPAAPREGGCKNCDYLPVCGPYEEERVKEKSPAELKSLKELRGWK
ncbi:MAG: PD-(D/E)XK nuclease family protein [Candidatus Solibacter sp.]|jgi:RecB family exonuclease